MIGNIFILCALASAVYSLVMYAAGIKGEKTDILKARAGFYISAVFIIAASAILANAVLTHKFYYAYVFNYSSRELPFGLLLSTFFAGQEGSFLLWLLFSAIGGLFFIDYLAKRSDWEKYAMIPFLSSIIFLLVLITPIMKSPFNYIWENEPAIELAKINHGLLTLPEISGMILADKESGKRFLRINEETISTASKAGISRDQIIAEGRGLNPLLQNFWMQIHPPVLFAGFALAIFPFAFAFGSLLKNRYDDWIKLALPWFSLSLAILGAALMLGGYWAYGVLGWGGYWGWDPVENASLVPWIIGVAAIHTMLLQLRKETENKPAKYIRTNLLLMTLFYAFILYSTYLTRSGILGEASVHSFVSPGSFVNIVLFSFLAIFVLVPMYMMFYRRKSLVSDEVDVGMLTREPALVTASAMLIGSASIIILGTSSPIWGDSVDVSFYSKMNLPIAILTGILNGLSIILHWNKRDTIALFKQIGGNLTTGVILTALFSYFLEIKNILHNLYVLSAFFALSVNFGLLSKTVKSGLLSLGGVTVHIGFGIFLLGVIASSAYSDSRSIKLEKGKSINIDGREISFNGYSVSEDSRIIFNVSVAEGKDKIILSPVMYESSFDNSIMREPDYKSDLMADLYAAPLSYDVITPGVFSLIQGDSVQIENIKVRFLKFEIPENAKEAMQAGKQFYVEAVLNVFSEGKEYELRPRIAGMGEEMSAAPSFASDSSFSVAIRSIDPEGRSEFQIIKKGSNINEIKEILNIEFAVNRLIFLVWIGVTITTIGFVLSYLFRLKHSRA